MVDQSVKNVAVDAALKSLEQHSNTKKIVSSLWLLSSLPGEGYTDRIVGAVMEILARNYDDLDVTQAALYTLHKFGKYDGQLAVKAFETHLRGKEKLCSTQRYLVVLVVEAIAKTSGFSDPEHAAVVRALLFKFDKHLDHDILMSLHTYDPDESYGPDEFMVDIFDYAYGKVRRMLHKSRLRLDKINNLAFLLSKCSQDRLYELLLERYRANRDEVSRAAVTMIMGRIDWDPEFIDRVESELQRRFHSTESSMPLVHLASACGLCFTGNMVGLSTVTSEMITPKLLRNPAGLGVVIRFEAATILAHLIRYLGDPTVPVSYVLKVEESYVHEDCLFLDYEAVRRVICDKITDSNPKVRQYMVTRAEHCINHEQIIKLVLERAEHDPVSEVRVAAIKSLGRINTNPACEVPFDAKRTYKVWDALAKILESDTDPEVCAAAAEGLREILRNKPCGVDLIFDRAD